MIPKYLTWLGGIKTLWIGSLWRSATNKTWSTISAWSSSMSSSIVCWFSAQYGFQVETYTCVDYAHVHMCMHHASETNAQNGEGGARTGKVRDPSFQACLLKEKEVYTERMSDRWERDRVDQGKATYQPPQSPCCSFCKFVFLWEQKQQSSEFQPFIFASNGIIEWLPTHFQRSCERELNVQHSYWKDFMQVLAILCFIRTSGRYNLSELFNLWPERYLRRLYTFYVHLPQF